MAQTFRDLIVWRQSHQLVLEIYKLTSPFPRSEWNNLVSQLRRAAVSVASNIVEGFKRRGARDSLHFYNISAASLEEVKYQLLIARDLSYLSANEYDNVMKLAEEVGRTLHGWEQSNRRHL